MNSAGRVGRRPPPDELAVNCRSRAMRVLRCQISAAVVLVSLSVVSAQTKITPPKNKYSPQQDVQLGREASAQVEQQLPLLRDDNVASYVSDIGRRLVSSIPAELRH